MVKEYLITTRDKLTWPKANHNSFFLGKWCIPFSKKENKFDKITLDYHWDDRNKLYNDYLYTQKFSMRVLNSLGNKLNQIHNVDYEIQHWNLIIGFWLTYFIQVIFDRWESISKSGKKTYYSICYKESSEELIPLDSKDFIIKTTESDRFNSFIYSLIMQKKGNFNLIFIEDPLSKKNYLKPIKKVKSSRRIYNFLYSKLTKKNSPFIYNPYLSIKNQIYLSLNFKSLPVLGFDEKKVTSKPDLNQRNWSLNFKAKSDFEEFVIKIIPKFIPLSYLEGFKKISNEIENSKLPKSPKFIFTANSFYFDDFFKIYAAKAIIEGAKFFSMQHGGTYGITKFNLYQDYQTSISDVFFSWGWSDNEKVKPLGYLNKLSSKKLSFFKKKEVLLVTAALSRYSYTIYSIPISSQGLKYFEDQTLFVENLNKTVRKNLTVRLSYNDYLWDHKKRWEYFSSNIKIDDGLNPINKLIAKTSIYVSTYNSTTFLESFFLDIPTVIYWNKSHWELNETAEFLFEELKAVKIFHESPVSAANHVNSIYNNPQKWWNNEEVKSVVINFKNNFCNKTKIKDLVREIKKNI